MRLRQPVRHRGNEVAPAREAALLDEKDRLTGHLEIPWTRDRSEGAKVDGDYLSVVAKNFLIAAVLVGVGFAGISVDLIFDSLGVPAMAYLAFIGGVLCPVAWLLGQTVPILTNLVEHERVGARFEEVLALLRRHRVRTGIATNGLLLHRHVEALLEHIDVCSTISFSIDGARTAGSPLE